MREKSRDSPSPKPWRSRQAMSAPDKRKGKSSKKDYRAFTAGSSLEDDFTLSSEDNEEEEVRYETATFNKEFAGKPSFFVKF